MTSNIILATDSYKASHWLQFPPGTQNVHCYIESRGGSYDRTVFFGLQAFLRRYLGHPITQADIDEAAEFFAAHGEPFHREGWEHILAAHGGRLPVEIKAAPEGLAIDTHNVLLTIVNTDPSCFWLPNYLETALLRADLVSDHRLHRVVPLQDRDPAGARAAPATYRRRTTPARSSCTISAPAAAPRRRVPALAGMAHLVNFMGTDTIEGVLAARRYYDEPMAGFSIPAAEHSTITSWGREGEVDAYRNMLRQFAKPGSMVAVVSDSYDLMHVVDTVWGGVLKDTILASGATVVVRPDSGDPLARAGRRAARAGRQVRQHGQQPRLQGAAALHPRDPG